MSKFLQQSFLFSINLIDFVHFSVNLANNVEILLHDHFSGSIYIANPLGLISIPRGFAPWDDEMSPSGLAISMHPSKWSCNNIFHGNLKRSISEIPQFSAIFAKFSSIEFYGKPMFKRKKKLIHLFWRIFSWNQIQAKFQNLIWQFFSVKTFKTTSNKLHESISRIFAWH